MFPFIFKLWRYHGLPTVDEIPDISRVQPIVPVSPVSSARVARADEYRQQAELQKTWHERYLPRLWGDDHPDLANGPRVILAIDEGTPASEGALKTARFLAERWSAALAESPVVGSAEEILKIAASEDADWIVVGHIPQKDRERVQLGSLVEAVVKEAERPVLVDRGGSLAGGVKRILIPVDGTAASLAPIAEGLRWARVFAAELMILHVAEKSTEGETEHRAFLDILETIRWQSTAHETRTGQGTIPDAILAAAREGKADLILMGTHRAEIGGQLLPRSHALDVLRGGDFPVMVLHPYEN